jgi:hypothetical protein
VTLCDSVQEWGEGVPGPPMKWVCVAINVCVSVCIWLWRGACVRGSISMSVNVFECVWKCVRGSVRLSGIVRVTECECEYKYVSGWKSGMMWVLNWQRICEYKYVCDCKSESCLWVWVNVCIAECEHEGLCVTMRETEIVPGPFAYFLPQVPDSHGSSLSSSHWG